MTRSHRSAGYDSADRADAVRADACRLAAGYGALAAFLVSALAAFLVSAIMALARVWLS